MEPHIDIVSLLIALGVLQAAIVAFVLFKPKDSGFDRYLCLLMICFALIETDSFLNHSGYMKKVVHLINLAPTFIFLVGPLVYAHSRKVISSTNHYSLKWFHFIPFVFYFIYSGFFFLQPETVKINSYLASFQPGLKRLLVHKPFPIDPLHIRGFIVVEGFALHMMIYVFLSFRLLRAYLHDKDSLLLNNSDRTVHWLRFLLLSMTGGTLIFILTGGIVNGYVIYPSVFPPYFIDLFIAAFIYSTTYYLLKHSWILKGEFKKYSKSSMSPEFMGHKMKELTTIMEKDKPFLSNEFSLTALAKRAGLTGHQASQILNTEVKMTFFEFTHYYRIREAQLILRHPGGREIKMEIMAQELGYNSKSAFFSAFKKATSTTPAKFREIPQTIS